MAFSFFLFYIIHSIANKYLESLYMYEDARFHFIHISDSHIDCEFRQLTISTREIAIIVNVYFFFKVAIVNFFLDRRIVSFVITHRQSFVIKLSNGMHKTLNLSEIPDGHWTFVFNLKLGHLVGDKVPFEASLLPRFTTIKHCSRALQKNYIHLQWIMSWSNPTCTER